MLTRSPSRLGLFVSTKCRRSPTTTRCVLVSGGASGLGEAVTRFFTQHGYDVGVLDIDQTRGESIVESIQKSQSSGKAHFARADITKEEDVQRALNEILPIRSETSSDCRNLVGVVNCAGICPPMRVYHPKKKQAHDLSLFHTVMNINVVGTFNLTRLAVQRMIETSQMFENETNARSSTGVSSRGVVVLTSSIAATEGQIGQAAYSASKGAVQGMCLPMARELAAHRIRVACIAPGVMHTPLMDGLPQAAQDQLAANVPYPRRLGVPEEFARLVYHIFENEYINGSTLRLDGALRMPP